jgi:hypothetical protein
LPSCLFVLRRTIEEATKPLIKLFHLVCPYETSVYWSGLLQRLNCPVWQCQVYATWQELRFNFSICKQLGYGNSFITIAHKSTEMNFFLNPKLLKVKSALNSSVSNPDPNLIVTWIQILRVQNQPNLIGEIIKSKCRTPDPDPRLLKLTYF